MICQYEVHGSVDFGDSGGPAFRGFANCNGSPSCSGAGTLLGIVNSGDATNTFYDYSGMEVVFAELNLSPYMYSLCYC